jgi:hypothetical protein
MREYFWYKGYTDFPKWKKINGEKYEKKWSKKRVQISIRK